MRSHYTRRECLAILASAAVPPSLSAQAAGKPMRGAFMILSTPYTEAGAVDWDDLVRETEFVERCGAHGARDLPPPVELIVSLAREFPHLGYVMKKRGIFKTTITRSRGGAGLAVRVSTPKLTADQVEEIEYRFAALKPYLS